MKRLTTRLSTTYGLYLQVLLSISLYLLSGCKETDTHTTLEITKVVSFSPDTHKFTADNPSINKGRYDPTGSDGYLLALVVKNNMQAPTTNAALSPTEQDAVIVNFEYCWYKDQEIDEKSSTSCAPIVALHPHQTRLISVNSFLPKSSSNATSTTQDDTQVIVFKVLSHADLQVLYGENFKPFEIQIAGLDPTTLVFNFTMQNSNALGDFNAEDPNLRKASLRIRLRAVGKTISGKTIYSNWLSYPLELCMGCFLDLCGSLTRSKLCTPANSTCGTLDCPIPTCTINNVTTNLNYAGHPCPPQLKNCDSDLPVCDDPDTYTPGGICPDKTPCTPKYWDYEGYLPYFLTLNVDNLDSAALFFSGYVPSCITYPACSTQ